MVIFNFFELLLVFSFIFSLALIGIVTSRHMLKILLCIELLFLSIGMKFLIFSFLLDDPTGQIFTFFMWGILAAESALALALYVCSSRSSSKSIFF